ncbi:hypothetical protein F5Y00DRAFT_272334 [Daldinia vernicosa]|uniref:uncharacterized protein n=1 Tax=Daldinia vernicosa TaxID=114800 RepID=UPI002007F5AD|nr:uncharacterized protein F5Y00DRAFT_272334 [Daldinia vernicosa]KAI0845962.1 hypothetical protein F5Y00DRAFT_272334 [Daldinia vernicosa]
MSQVYRERDVRYTREDDPSSDDDRYTSTTVRRYKVGGGGRVVERDRIERYEEDDDRRSRHSHSHSHSNVGRSSGETLEVDRRVERTSYPERPRSAFDSHDHDRYRTVEYERERDVDRDHYPERHSRTKVVEEIKTSSPSPRDHYWDRRSAYPWDDVREDVRTEKRIVREDANGELQLKEKTEEYREEPRDYKERDLMIERRVEVDREPHDVDIERYRKEVEYYAAPTPPQAPVVIRQKFPEQKVVIHEAPAPAPVILPRQEPTYIVLRDERRQVAPRPEPREEEDYHYRREDRRRRDERQYESDGYDEDYYIKRTIITRERSSSSDRHKKRHLAEGALAGAGLTALLSGHGGKNSEYPEHRGRKVLAGAALGAIGSEAVRRAKSAYEDRHEDRYEDHYDDSYRHQHRSKSRSRLTTGLAIGAAALAVAGGLKYMQNNKVEKEEANRGRARRRYSTDGYSTSRSRSGRGRSRSKSKSKAAKAALATGAVAGIVKHYRSKSRGKSRSKSRLRTGAEIAAAGLTGAAAEKLWERHKEKKESKEREHHRDSDDEYYDRDRGYSRSRSRSRSLSRHSHSRDSTADRELGLVPVVPGVEYGSKPIEGYESATEEPRRRRKHDHRSPSTSDREARKKRSRSRLRGVTAAGIGTAAAAMGIKKYQDRQKSKEREGKSREASRDRSLDREDRDKEKRKARRSRDRERRRYEEEAPDDPYYDYHTAMPPSPLHASGGAYYPPPPASEPTGPPPAGPAGFTQHPNPSTPNVNAYSPYPPYNPQDYAGVPSMNLPPPPGPPLSGPPRGMDSRTGPENVSHPRSGDIQSHPDASRSTATEQDGLKHRQRSSSSLRSRSVDAEPPAAKVKFVPLSPKSSRTLRRHRRRMGERSEEEIEEELALLQRPRNLRRRSGSDVSSNRPRVQRRRVRGDESPVSDDSEIEYLPDRFDPSGQPLETTNTAVDRFPRQGSFEYLPRNDDDWHIRGAWRSLGDPDPALVSDIAQTLGGLLRPGGSLMNMFGNALRDI